jgi:hypothetical protein
MRVRDEGRGMTTVAVVVSIFAVAALVWIAGEEHYQGCVASAVAVTEPRATVPGIREQVQARANGSVAPKNSARIKAVNGCSRLPF